MKRDSCMLAQVFKEQRIRGWFLSEKLDGMRAIWAPWTRGMALEDVPWANMLKVDRLRELPVSTGLWSRYFNPIMAPDWWLDKLPEDICMDGELYMGRKMFQETVSCTKRLDFSGPWEDVQYVAFDAPNPRVVFAEGSVRINGNRYLEVGNPDTVVPNIPVRDLRGRLEILRSTYAHVVENPQVDPFDFLNHIVEQGGEGVIARNPRSLYVCKRSKDMLKLKPSHDDEGIVTGYVAGKGKFEGMLGALILDYKGQKLELSGFTDAERQMGSFHEEPGERIFTSTSEHFPLGSSVTFTYRELSRDGIPKEARYFRRRPLGS